MWIHGRPYPPEMKAGDDLIELLYTLRCIKFETYMVVAWHQVGKKIKLGIGK